MTLSIAALALVGAFSFLESTVKNKSFQSADYVPGVSGMRLDLHTGAIEINGGRVALGALPSEPQVITVTAGEWSESDMPANAIERYRFIGEQVMAIPAEHRDGAEFSTEDISFDRDGSDMRTTLTYRRLETDREAADRFARQAGPSTSIKADGTVSVTVNGRVVCRIGAQDRETTASAVLPPFVVEKTASGADQVFANAAAIEVGKLDAAISIKTTTLESGARVMAGLASDLHGSMEDHLEGTIRRVLRQELKPGGMLHSR